MAHCITALIVQSPAAGHLLERWSLPSAPLRDGWRLVPLEEEDLDGLGLDFSQALDGSCYLSPSLAEFCAGLSRFGPVVYAETAYFGGMGTQAAAAFPDGGAPGPAPAAGEGAINRALESVGIRPADAGAGDAFDFIGLSRHRATSDWKSAATA